MSNMVIILIELFLPFFNKVIMRPPQCPAQIRDKLSKRFKCQISIFLHNPHTLFSSPLDPTVALLEDLLVEQALVDLLGLGVGDVGLEVEGRLDGADDA